MTSNNGNNRVWFYGFREDHRVVAWRYLCQKDFSPNSIRRVIFGMLDMHPDIVDIFAIGDRKGLKEECYRATHTNRFDIWYDLYDEVVRDGVIVGIEG